MATSRGAVAAGPRRPKRLVVDTHPGLPPLLFGAVAVLLGAFAGFGAFGFRVLIALCHNLAFLGRLSTDYNTNLRTPPLRGESRSPWSRPPAPYSSSFSWRPSPLRPGATAFPR